MDTKSKVLIGLFFAMVVATTVWKFHVFVTKQDFLVLDHVSCDPFVESCFVYDCLQDEEGCDSEPFKKISKNAKYISDCRDAWCPLLACSLGEKDCSITFCSEGTLEDGEICLYNPIIYTKIEPTATSSESATE